jgi:hypothetical protein
LGKYALIRTPLSGGSDLGCGAAALTETSLPTKPTAFTAFGGTSGPGRDAPRRNKFGRIARDRQREPMLLIAVGLTVLLVAADLFDVSRRAGARRARPHG